MLGGCITQVAYAGTEPKVAVHISPCRGKKPCQSVQFGNWSIVDFWVKEWGHFKNLYILH